MWWMTALAFAGGADDDPWRTLYVAELAALHVQGHAVYEGDLSEDTLDTFRVMAKAGTRVFLRDRLAWVSTDALHEAGVADLAGWITDVDGDQVRIHWVEAGDVPMSRYEGVLDGDQVRWTHGPDDAAPEPLPDHLLTAWSCRQQVIRAMQRQEIRPPHPSPNLVVELVGSRPWVYVTPPVSDERGYYVGGVLTYTCEEGGLRELAVSDERLMTIPLEHDLAKVHIVAHSRIEVPTPAQFFQAMLLDRPMAVQALGHAWYITAGDEHHYLGPLPETRRAGKKRLRRLAKDKP